MHTAIWWIRRDLRLHDNPALSHALEHAEQVIPLFILDPHLLSNPPTQRDLFLFEALHALDKNLQIRNSRLIIRKGNPLAVLQKLSSVLGGSLIVAEADHSPYAISRDEEVGKHLPLHTLTGLTVHPPRAVRKSDGGPYSVYTPYSRVWKSLPTPGKPIGSLEVLPEIDEAILSTDIPTGKSFDRFPASEKAARKRLVSFLDDPVFMYQKKRNALAVDGTARISPYLKFGLLSMRETVYQAKACLDATDNQSAKQGCTTWLNELIWREFYFSILANFPHIVHQSYRENLRDLRWADDPHGLKAWQEGLTGYPVVDAAMRQLRETGWMHNRARMITASFLTKDLLIDWREGERWFMQHLVDGDLASNNGGWQWTAGTGTDAAPYFRIFNPILQSKKFDPDGIYIRRWVPELAHLDAAQIHTPWKNPNLKADYPAPIIDHRAARERTLAAYKSAKTRWEDQSK